MQMKRIEDEISHVVANNEYYKKLTTVLEMLPGIGNLYSSILSFELSDIQRFHHAKALMKYSGLVPGKHSSGNNDPALHITKEGNRFIRLAFVGIAKSYRDRRLLKSSHQLKSLPAVVSEFIQKMQDRLYNRYRYLRNQGKHSNVARCAIARELCGFILELVTVVMPKVELDNQYKTAA